MTKKEFEKEFKVGDEITCKQWRALSPSKIVCIRDCDFIAVDIADDDIQKWKFSELDWQKVEPVKKYWKHVFEVEWGTPPTTQVEVRNLNEKCNQERITYLFGDRYTLIKEPTEITLGDI